MVPCVKDLLALCNKEVYGWRVLLMIRKRFTITFMINIRIGFVINRNKDTACSFFAAVLHIFILLCVCVLYV